VTVDLVPITDDDVPAVARFMHDNLNRRVSPRQWAAAIHVPWQVDSPNHGFMLLDGDTVVGAYLAYYSDRLVDGRLEPFCNLGAWCVLEEHRFQGLRLLKALLAQRKYHFTDLSPSGNVVRLNERLKFEVLDTTTALMPNVPWPPLTRSCRLTDDPDVLRSSLTGAELTVYADHERAAAARHLLMAAGDEHCYVIYRRDRRKGLPLFASVLHVSNPDLFLAHATAFGRHLLLHHGIPATLVERRIVGARPALSLQLGRSRPKMFKSPTVGADRIDYLYSELTCLAW
jgi:hypothetical protein